MTQTVESVTAYNESGLVNTHGIIENALDAFGDTQRYQRVLVVSSETADAAHGIVNDGSYRPDKVGITLMAAGNQSVEELVQHAKNNHMDALYVQHNATESTPLPSHTFQAVAMG